jgi:hypothetical protein
MPGPLPILLGVAAAGAAYMGYKKLTTPAKPAVDPYGQPMVSALKKGQAYAFLVMLDWQKIPGATPTVPDQEAYSTYIKGIFEGSTAGGFMPDPSGIATATGLGFKVLSKPMIRNNEEAKKFLAGQPSAWILTAQWLKDTSAVEMTPALNKVLPMAAVYPLSV